LHHILLDRWSQGASPLHRRDARAKIVALLVFLVLLATTPENAIAILVTDAALLASAILIAGLPLSGILLRAMVVLPFSLTFGLISWLAGEPSRALALVEKSYLSTVAVLLLAGTTSLPLLLGGLERLGVPRLLVLVAQFLYRCRNRRSTCDWPQPAAKGMLGLAEVFDFARLRERWRFCSRDLTTEPKVFTGPCKRANSQGGFRFSIPSALARSMPYSCCRSPHSWCWCAWDDSAD
jgi:hypothetical protein